MKREQEFIKKEDLLNDLYSDNPDDILGYIARYKPSYDVLDERERFRHELHDMLGKFDWGTEDFWLRVHDIECLAADLHMRYKAEGKINEKLSKNEYE